MLSAMGLGALAGEAIRVSLPWNVTDADIAAFRGRIPTRGCSAVSRSWLRGLPDPKSVGMELPPRPNSARLSG